ncbi:hypothetical protein HPP92_027427 [Vanilla planifolia]|uniref:Cathepsin propeptide inhibitor domain-containing protein n=1 Tax=Vanilla planifolia TaxID=51239 RepID=A0A835P9Y8_VANPL|nr:hypothetical protein HPP92_027427 [Vanilla planifolia]KAG0449239.1 hypothetical protein HPP92_027455 [Vanilla planifolia]
MNLILWGSWAAVSASCILLGEASMDELHERWMAEHGKTCVDWTEKARRLEIFAANMKLIESFNAHGQNHMVDANRFADLNNEVFGEK